MRELHCPINDTFLIIIKFRIKGKTDRVYSSFLTTHGDISSYGRSKVVHSSGVFINCIQGRKYERDKCS